MDRRPPALLLALSVFASLTAAHLLISQVVEGSGFNKILVLTNRGAEPVNLSQYSLWIAFNGQPWRKRIQSLAPKTLPPGDSYALCNSRVAQRADPHCDDTNGFLLFDGNDALGLQTAGAFVDLFGDESGLGLNSKGTAFVIAGVDDGSLDRTVLRLAGVTEGNTDWPASASTQWDLAPKDSFIVNGTAVSLGPKVPGEPAAPPSPPGDTPAGGAPTGACKSKSGLEIAECEAPLKPGGDRREDKGRLVVGTFNAQWLFNGESDNSKSRWLCDPAGAAEHLRAVAEVIRRNAPDVLGLQEVEDCTRLAELSGLLTDYRGYLKQGRDFGTGQDAALLTKVDPSGNLTRSDARAATPEGSGCGAAIEDTGASKHFVARFPALEGLPFEFAVVCVHLKAFPTNPEACAQREGQAKVIQEEVARLLGDGLEVVVLGDFNDLSDLHAGVACSNDGAPTSRVLSMLRDVDGDGKDDLRNAIEFVIQGERYSSSFVAGGTERRTLIDHVLLTPGLWDLVDDVWIDHTGEDLPREDRVSDHWPILVSLRTDGTGGRGATVDPPPCG